MLNCCDTEGRERLPGLFPKEVSLRTWISSVAFRFFLVHVLQPMSWTVLDLPSVQDLFFGWQGGKGGAAWLCIWEPSAGDQADQGSVKPTPQAQLTWSSGPHGQVTHPLRAHRS